MIRAEEASVQSEHDGKETLLPAGLVDEKVLAWCFNAPESWTELGQLN
jgi:hypothetical protein